MAGDALAVINFINAHTAGSVAPGSPNSQFAAPAYVDVDADDQVVAADALSIINYINAGNAPEGEGGSVVVANDSFFSDLGAFPDPSMMGTTTTTTSTSSIADDMNDLIMLLATDTVTEQLKRRRV